MKALLYPCSTAASYKGSLALRPCDPLCIPCAGWRARAREVSQLLVRLGNFLGPGSSNARLLFAFRACAELAFALARACRAFTKLRRTRTEYSSLRFHKAYLAFSGFCAKLKPATRPVRLLGHTLVLGEEGFIAKLGDEGYSENLGAYGFQSGTATSQLDHPFLR